MEKKGLILGWHQRYLLDDMHVELIRNGFKDKACSMPISALGLDILINYKLEALRRQDKASMNEN